MGRPQLVPSRVEYVMGSQALASALVASQCICLRAMWLSGPRSWYKVTACYLGCAIWATIYSALESPERFPTLFFLAMTALFRFAACLEVAHRQTAGFRYWSRLMASVMLLASAAAGVVWLGFGARDAFGMVIEIRRGMQVWCAAMFVALECCWLAVGGGWYRRVDRIAAAFTLLAINHGAVSLLRAFNAGGDWHGLHGRSWSVEVACYLFLTWAFLSAPKPVQRSL